MNTVDIRKNIFTCLSSVHNAISLSRHEQVCLIRLCFARYFSYSLDQICLCMTKFGYIVICLVGKLLKAVSLKKTCSKQSPISFLREIHTKS